MNWTMIVDILFALGATACAAFLVYGGWLCRRALNLELPKTQLKSTGGPQTRPDARPVEFSSSVAMPLLAAVLALDTSGIAQLLL